MALTDLIPDPNSPMGGLPPMQGGLPQLGRPLMPLVTSQRQPQEDQAAKKAATPTGLSSLQAPAQGFWQHVRKIAEGIGNVAGDVVAPSTMALIPGTQLHRALEHRAGVQELAGLQSQDRADATEARSDVTAANENALRTAQTGEATTRTEGIEQENELRPSTQTADVAYKNAQAANLLHPQAKTDFEAWQQQNPGKAIDEWLKLKASNTQGKGDDFEKYYKDYIVDNNLPDSAHNRQIARKDWAAASQAPQRAPIVNMFVPGADGSSTLQTIHPGQSVAPGATTASGLNTQTLTTGKEASKEQKAAQGVVDDAQTAHVLAKEAEAGNAPADVDLALAFFKAIKGSGTGIRFTQQEQNLIRGSRNTAGDLEGIAQKVIGGGQMFTPEQRNNLLRVMDIHAQQAKNHVSSGSKSGGQAEEYVRDASGKLVKK